MSIITSLPTGASASFNPSVLKFEPKESSKTSTLTITTTSSTPVGTYYFTVKAQAAVNDYKTGDGTLNVQAAPPTFSVTFDATGIGDLNGATEVLAVTIGDGSPISVTKAELPKTFTGIASGTTITYSYNSPLASTTTGKQYRWGSTSGTGSASEQTGQSGSFSLKSTSTVTGTYVTQYRLTIQTSGLASASYPTNVKLGGSTVGTAYDSSPYTQWFDAGAPSGTIGVDAIVSGGTGTQFVFTKWNEDSSTDNPRDSVTMDSPKTFTAVYKTQYYVTFAQTGLDSSATGTVVTVDSSAKTYGDLPFSIWVDSGDTVTYDYESIVLSSVSGKRFSLVDVTGPSSPITVSSSTTVTGTYKTQFRVNIGWSGLDDDATGKVVTITVVGVDNVKNAGDSFFDEWIDSGTSASYSYESIVDSTMPNKAYKLVSVTGTSTSASQDFGAISGPISETGNYGSIILFITKKAPSAVFVGDTIRYIYEVTNTGTTSATGITVTDGSLKITFVGGDVDGDNKLDPKETWVYTATYCPVSASDKPSITNIAKVSCDEGAIAEDKATVDVYQLEVTKTAETSFTRTYTWTISKTATPSILIFSSGTDTSTVDYNIVLSATYEDSGWKVTGTITIYNPAPIDAVITNIKDIVSPDIGADIDFAFPYTLGAGQTLELTYSADLPDDTSRTNTVTVTIQNYERPFLWDLTGDWVIRVYYGGTYDHDFSLTMASDGLAFTGTGGYPASGPPYSITEAITGVAAVDDVFWHSVYNTGYFWDAKGTIASDGTMSGTWTSSIGQAGTWASISGSATLVKLETETSDLKASANVDFGSATITKVDESVTVTDTYSGGPQGETVNYADAPKTFTYDRTTGPYANIGIYTVENTVKFVTCDTKTEGEAHCTVTVYRIGSAVTSSSFYLFDYDATAPGRQFKLILTPDVPTSPNLYRVTATNPGQFFYNIFYYGDVSEPFVITIPDPFVTQGANPVHIYDSISTSGDYVLPSGNDITSQFTIVPNYSDGDFTGFTITPIDGYSGPVYITIHLDYGYKKTLGGLGKDSDNNALEGTSFVKIYDLTDYTFSVSGPLTDSDTIQNRNVFKRDPGFVGLVTDSEGNPIANVKVQIYGPDGKLLAIVYTDKDGWYFFNYKYTGKAATFTIKLPEYNLQQSVTLKANSFVVANFQIT